MCMAIRKIILPLAPPGLAVTACFIFLASYIEFLFALILSRGSINTLPLAISGYMTELQTFYNEMAAASFLSMIPLALFFYFAGRYMVGGLSLGALKSHRQGTNRYGRYSAADRSGGIGTYFLT